ncbi:hypothetical protein PGT21_001048 [Puccinia graminis f. sp. tritici]|uniref:Uncharacterized protein n=1 Tax=Puccinia graminis f. sp. tritici TaxID=56615 RepID=A0A5B0Q4I0_PUCGR|nr:hypothetical protein PGT21_001048 [Puccinia graminis f. sp. tritici]
METGCGLTEEEEEWLDNGGNLIEEFVLMDRLKEISPNNQHIAISATDIVIIEKINTYEIDKPQAKPSKTTSSPQPKSKTAVASPIAKKKTPVATPSAKKKESVKEKLNLKSASKASRKPVRATLAQKLEVLDWHRKNGENQTKTARHFAEIYPEIGFKQPLVSAWVKEEDRI